MLVSRSAAGAVGACYRRSADAAGDSALVGFNSSIIQVTVFSAGADWGAAVNSRNASADAAGNSALVGFNSTPSTQTQTLTLPPPPSVQRVNLQAIPEHGLLSWEFPGTPHDPHPSQMDVQ